MATTVALQPRENSIWSNEQESALINALEESIDTTIDIATPLVVMSGQAVVNTYITSGANKCVETMQAGCVQVLPANVVPIGNKCVQVSVSSMAEVSKKAAAPLITNCAKTMSDAAKDSCHRGIEASVQSLNKRA